MSNPEKPSSSSTVPQSHETVESPEVEEACQRALATRFHSFKDALKQADELCSKHKELPMVHLTRGQLLGIHAAEMNDGDKNKRKVLEDAIESLQLAVSMLPESPEYAYFLASVLFHVAKINHAGYDKAVQECERALNLDIWKTGESSPEEFQRLKVQIEELIEFAQNSEELDQDYTVSMKNKATASNLKEKKQAELIKREKERDQEFVKKTGEYWCNLSYEEKCMILDVDIKDVESFYRSGKNKNLTALNMLTEAVELYTKRGKWVTWTCCICDEDRDKEDNEEVWTSLQKHIDMHFDNSEPRVEGSPVYEIADAFDSLEFDYSNGVFILHMVLDKDEISGRFCNSLLANNTFLVDWLRKESNVKLAVELWENRRKERSKIGSEIMVEVVKVKDDLKEYIEKIEKEMEETTEDTDMPQLDISSFLTRLLPLKEDAVCNSAHDYRKIVFPLLKSFIQARLVCLAEELAWKKADAMMAELTMDQSVGNKNLPTKSSPSKNKKKKGNRKSKVASPVQKKLEEGQSSGKDDNVKQQEEDIKEGSEHEAKESIEETLDTNLRQPTFFVGDIPIYMNNPQTEQDEIADEVKELEKKVARQLKFEEEMKAKRLRELSQQLEDNMKHR